MKNNILMDLKEYKKMLEDKFGFNNINIPSDDYHTSLDEIGNGINLYVRERLGNFIKVYKDDYCDCCYEFLIGYVGNFDKENNVFILKICNSGKIYQYNYDIHFFKANASELIYAKIGKNKDYLLVEKVKFGNKVDVVEIRTKFYDECIFNYFSNFENLYDLVDKINSGETSIVPEVEFVSKIYEDKIKIETNKTNNIKIYNYLKDEYIAIDGIVNDIYRFKCDSYSKFYEKEAVELLVYDHFAYMNKNIELINECLGKELKRNKTFVRGKY